MLTCISRLERRNSPYSPKPALLTRTSTCSPAPSVASKICCGAWDRVRSATITCAWTPLLVRSRSASRSSRSRRRAVSTRFTPASASSTAIASPIPALAPVTTAHLPCHALRTIADAIAYLLLMIVRGAGEFLAHPLGKGIHLLFTAKKVLDQLRARFGSARLENGLPVAHCRRSLQQIGAIELAEEIERNHLVEHVGVVIRCVADQVGEAGIHAIAVNPLVGQHALVALLEHGIRIQLLGRPVVHVEGVAGVEELGAHAIGSSKGAGPIHPFDQSLRDRLARLVVAGEGREKFGVVEKLFQHLRGHFDKVAFGRNAAHARPFLTAAENG